MPSPFRSATQPSCTYTQFQLFQQEGLLKFKTFIQFMVEDLGQDLDSSVTGNSLSLLPPFPLSFLPSFPSFSSPFLDKWREDQHRKKGKKINIKKRGSIFFLKKERRSTSRRQLRSREGWDLGDLSSGPRALWMRNFILLWCPQIKSGELILSP